ncbi:hypothetical protein ACHAPA_010250, partial [Fusarium lateritium]
MSIFSVLAHDENEDHNAGVTDNYSPACDVPGLEHDAHDDNGFDGGKGTKAHLDTQSVKMSGNEVEGDDDSIDAGDKDEDNNNYND